MKKEVVRVHRCMFCNQDTHFIVRSENANSNLTADHIYSMGSTMSENPYAAGHCEQCGNFTLQIKIAYLFNGSDQPETTLAGIDFSDSLDALDKL